MSPIYVIMCKDFHVLPGWFNIPHDLFCDICNTLDGVFEDKGWRMAMSVCGADLNISTII